MRVGRSASRSEWGGERRGKHVCCVSWRFASCVCVCVHRVVALLPPFVLVFSLSGPPSSAAPPLPFLPPLALRARGSDSEETRVARLVFCCMETACDALAPSQPCFRLARQRSFIHRRPSVSWIEFARPGALRNPAQKPHAFAPILLPFADRPVFSIGIAHLRKSRCSSSLSWSSWVGILTTRWTWFLAR